MEIFSTSPIFISPFLGLCTELFAILLLATPLVKNWELDHSRNLKDVRQMETESVLEP